MPKFDEIDSLTGLLSIRAFREKAFDLQHNLDLENRQIAVVFLDLVDFKGLNERRGFEEGDKTLIRFADLMKESFHNRFISRFGSDHFAIILYADEVSYCFSKLRQLMDDDSTLNMMHFRSGVCVITDPSFDSVIACDRAKIAADSIRGENDKVRYYDDELDLIIRRQRYISENIDIAIQNEYIRVYYQPVISSITGNLVGMEALARWDDPNYGFLSPGVFIPTLEEKHLIHKLDMCVLDRVCRDLKNWEDNGIPTVPVSFNLSRLDFELCDAIGIIEKTVRKYRIQTSLLHIEITESTLGTNEDYISNIIDRAHSGGFEVWMDDFGSGYSSLNVLKDYDFDLIKIDMKFLSEFNDRSKEIIRSVVSMAKSLGIHVLAEGVETEEHVRFLREIGCEKLQGFYYSRPVPVNDATMLDFKKKWGIEPSVFTNYYKKIGLIPINSINRNGFLDPAARQNVGRKNMVPVAIIEYYDNKYHTIFSNSVFQEEIGQFGIADENDFADYLSSKATPFSKNFYRKISEISEPGCENDTFRIDFRSKGKIGLINVRKIASASGRYAFLLYFENLSGSREYRKLKDLGHISTSLHSIFDFIFLIDYEHGFYEKMYEKDSSNVISDGRLPLKDAAYIFSERYIHPDDRTSFMRDFAKDRFINDISNSKNGYSLHYYRALNNEGGFSWAEFLSFRTDLTVKSYAVCFGFLGEREAYLIDRFMCKADENNDTFTDLTKGITKSELWDTFMSDRRFGIFWKDADRKFLGANRVFLDYYGLLSQNDILGKNDEDMRWHIDPEPFKKDEEAVLKYGRSTRMILGKCIANGSNRDIAATKRPVYRDGRIIGLLGYFVDVTEDEEEKALLSEQKYHDRLTGLLNRNGLKHDIIDLVDAYTVNGIDFALFYVDIRDFRKFNENYGTEVGDMVLRLFAQRLKETVGRESLIGRYAGDQFIICAQIKSEDDIKSIHDGIEKSASKIIDIDGIPCTIYVSQGYALYSETNNTMKMTSVAFEKAVNG